MVTELTSQTLKQALEKGPTVIDFWAPWCGPCRSMAPIFEKVSHDFKGKLEFAKINVEEFGEISGEFGVSAIPCLIVFKGGKEVERITGLLPEPALRSKLTDALKK